MTWSCPELCFFIEIIKCVWWTFWPAYWWLDRVILCKLHSNISLKWPLWWVRQRVYFVLQRDVFSVGGWWDSDVCCRLFSAWFIISWLLLNQELTTLMHHDWRRWVSWRHCWWCGGMYERLLSWMYQMPQLRWSWDCWWTIVWSELPENQGKWRSVLMELSTKSQSMIPGWVSEEWRSVCWSMFPHQLSGWRCRGWVVETSRGVWRPEDDCQWCWSVWCCSRWEILMKQRILTCEHQVSSETAGCWQQCRVWPPTNHSLMLFCLRIKAFMKNTVEPSCSNSGIMESGLR